jgi:hypothetical protein
VAAGNSKLASRAIGKNTEFPAIFPQSGDTGKSDRNASRAILAATLLLCVFQFVWIVPKCFHQIDIDGMTYTGLARLVREGQFYRSINAFRSPLVSWLIAATSIGRTDYLRTGKLLSAGSFLLCLILLYEFALQLWRSRLVAALAVLLLVLGRGLAVIAIAYVTPDFLVTALVLAYFMLLLRCFRAGSARNWFLLGGIHALAFLAKAFALPWLACCTFAAVLISRGSLRKKFTHLLAGAAMPLVIAAAWSIVLHSKYGVYTTGSQFKTNLLQWTLHVDPNHQAQTYSLLRDTSKEIDDYAVVDPMPPGSRAWTYRAGAAGLLPKLLHAEEINVPKALKELAIVLTPGILLAFILCVTRLYRKRQDYPLEWRLTAVIAIGAATLVVAYSTLVFDERYLFPILPLLLAVGARFLVKDPLFGSSVARKISIVLMILGACISLTYAASPFRSLTRDYLVPSYQAGTILRNRPDALRLVSIGSGSFPAHGVGWEAGYQAAYFGGKRLIATRESLPDSTELKVLEWDLAKAHPDALVVWGNPNDIRYVALLRALGRYSSNTPQKILDPFVGEVGAIVFCSINSFQS